MKPLSLVCRCTCGFGCLVGSVIFAVTLFQRLSL